METEYQFNHFTLTIQSISIDVKFPCSLYLEHSGDIFTKGASPSQNQKYIINQQITIKWQKLTDEMEIFAYLKTDSGAKYLGGIIRLDPQQLIKLEGQNINVPLTKAIDPNAYCQLRVDQINREKQFPKNALEMQNYGTHQKIRHTEKRIIQNQNFESPSRNPRTKSELQYRLQRKKSTQNDVQARYSNANPQKQQFLSHHSSYGLKLNSERDKIMDVEAYKQSYRKLKQKYRRESQIAKNQQNKRIALEANENNLKIQIMRLTMKIEELEKSLVDKGQKLREYQHKVGEFQKKQKDACYLQEELQAKCNMISMLESNIQTLNKENHQLRQIQDLSNVQFSRKMLDQRGQFQKSRRQLSQRIQGLEFQLKKVIDQNKKLEIDLKFKQERVARQQQVIDDLENNAHIRVLEFETRINECKAKLYKEKQQLEMQYTKLQNTNQQLLDKIQQLEKQRNEQQKQTLQISLQYETTSKNLQEFKHREAVHKRQNTQLNKINSQLQESVKQKNHEIEEKEDRIGELVKQIKRNEDNYCYEEDKLKQKIQELKCLIGSLQSDVKSRQNDLRNYRMSITQLQANVELLNKQKQKLLDTIEQLEASTLNLQTRNKSIQHNLQQRVKLQNEIYMRELQIKESSLTKSRNKIHKLENTVDKLQQQLENQRRNHSHQQQQWQLSSLRNEQSMEHYKQQIAEQIKDIEYLKDKIKRGEKEYELNQEAYGTLLGELRKKEFSFQHIRNQKQLLQELEKMREGALNRRYTDLEVRYQTVIQLNQDLKRKIQGHKHDQLNSLAQKQEFKCNDSQYPQLETQRTEHINNEHFLPNSHTTEKQEIQEQLQSTLQSNQKLKGEIEQLTSKGDRLQYQCDSLKMNIKKIYVDIVELAKQLYNEEKQIISGDEDLMGGDYLGNFGSLFTRIRNYKDKKNDGDNYQRKRNADQNVKNDKRVKINDDGRRDEDIELIDDIKKDARVKSDAKKDEEAVMKVNDGGKEDEEVNGDIKKDEEIKMEVNGYAKKDEEAVMKVNDGGKEDEEVNGNIKKDQQFNNDIKKDEEAYDDVKKNEEVNEDVKKQEEVNEDVRNDEEVNEDNKKDTDKDEEVNEDVKKEEEAKEGVKKDVDEDEEVNEDVKKNEEMYDDAKKDEQVCEDVKKDEELNEEVKRDEEVNNGIKKDVEIEINNEKQIPTKYINETLNTNKCQQPDANIPLAQKQVNEQATEKTKNHLRQQIQVFQTRMAQVQQESQIEKNQDNIQEIDQNLISQNINNQNAISQEQHKSKQISSQPSKEHQQPTNLQPNIPSNYEINYHKILQQSQILTQQLEFEQNLNRTLQQQLSKLQSEKLSINIDKKELQSKVKQLKAQLNAKQEQIQEKNELEEKLQCLNHELTEKNEIIQKLNKMLIHVDDKQLKDNEEFQKNEQLPHIKYQENKIGDEIGNEKISEEGQREDQRFQDEQHRDSQERQEEHREKGQGLSNQRQDEEVLQKQQGNKEEGLQEHREDGEVQHQQEGENEEGGHSEQREDGEDLQEQRQNEECSQEKRENKEVKGEHEYQKDNVNTEHKDGLLENRDKEKIKNEEQRDNEKFSQKVIFQQQREDKEVNNGEQREKQEVHYDQGDQEQRGTNKIHQIKANEQSVKQQNNCKYHQKSKNYQSNEDDQQQSVKPSKDDMTDSQNKQKKQRGSEINDAKTLNEKLKPYNHPIHEQQAQEAAHEKSETQNNEMISLKQHIQLLEQQVKIKDNQIQEMRNYVSTLEDKIVAIQQQHQFHTIQNERVPQISGMDIIGKHHENVKESQNANNFEPDQKSEQPQKSHMQTLKVLEQKLQQTQDLRKKQVAQKSNEIMQILQTLKAKQTIIYKMQKELKVAHTIISTLQNYKKNTEDKIRNINILYSKQLQTLKKKRSTKSRDYKELFSRLQSDLQNEIRAILEAFMDRTLRKTKSTKIEALQSVLIEETSVVEHDIVNLLHQKCKLRSQSGSEVQSSVSNERYNVID